MLHLRRDYHHRQLFLAAYRKAGLGAAVPENMILPTGRG